jgi:hypothetical protein
VWRRLAVGHRRFGTAYWSHLLRVKQSCYDCLTLKYGHYPETSTTNHLPTPWNISEEGRPQLHRGGSLKSPKIVHFFGLSQQCNLAEDATSSCNVGIRLPVDAASYPTMDSSKQDSLETCLEQREQHDNRKLTLCRSTRDALCKGIQHRSHCSKKKAVGGGGGGTKPAARQVVLRR